MARSLRAKAPLFQGVEDWFARIDAHALERQLALEHYVISSAMRR